MILNSAPEIPSQPLPERRNAIDFFRKIGIVKNRVGNAILAGGGKVSFYLAKILIQSGIRVTIIEINPSRATF